MSSPLLLCFSALCPSAPDTKKKTLKKRKIKSDTTPPPPCKIFIIFKILTNTTHVLSSASPLLCISAPQHHWTCKKLRAKGYVRSLCPLLFVFSWKGKEKERKTRRDTFMFILTCKRGFELVRFQNWLWICGDGNGYEYEHLCVCVCVCVADPLPTHPHTTPRAAGTADSEEPTQPTPRTGESPEITPIQPMTDTSKSR